MYSVIKAPFRVQDLEPLKEKKNFAADVYKQIQYVYNVYSQGASQESKS